MNKEINKWSLTLPKKKRRKLFADKEIDQVWFPRECKEIKPWILHYMQLYGGLFIGVVKFECT